MKKHIIYKLFFWAWLIIITLLNLIPTSPSHKIEFGNGFSLRLDYVEHITAYALLIFLYVIQDSKYNLNSLSKIKLILIVLFGIIYACITEYLQKFIQGRVFNPYDLISNVIGIGTGMIVIYGLSIKSSKNK